MNIEPKIILAVLVAVLATAACTQAKSKKAEAIDRVKPSQTMLTSTAPAPAPTPSETKKPVAPITDVVDTPMVEPKAIETAPSFEPELRSIDGLSIERLVTAPGIERREPVAASSVFGDHDERVYAFVEVRNDSERDETLLVHFIGPDGQVSGGIELRIPASTPRWRTWAYTRNANEPGLWRVEIRSEDGALLGALPFEVEHGC